jgi:hypothetical protein
MSADDRIAFFAGNTPPMEESLGHVAQHDHLMESELVGFQPAVQNVPGVKTFLSKIFCF